MTYDFSGLTRAQMGLLNRNGWRKYTRTPSPKPKDKTVRPLLERKLIVALYEGSMLVGFHVPLDVHEAWCKTVL